MADGQEYRSRIELLQGTLDLLLLQTLRWGPQHGYGLSQLLRLRSGERLQVDTGSLYPALHRLQRQKLLTSEWQLSENNQRVKVYSLTAKGRRQLAAERTKWEELSAAIAGVLEEPAPEGRS
jgi:PadR family transcriptional regulator, regulatory protein PadR